MLETLRGRLDNLRIGSRMCHTLVQARTARFIGGSTSDEFGRPSYDCHMFTSLDGLKHGRVLETNLFDVIGVAERHRYTDTRRRLFDLRLWTSPSARWCSLGSNQRQRVSQRVGRHSYSARSLFESCALASCGILRGRCSVFSSSDY